MALLEGGYFLPSLAEGAALTLRQLLGQPCPALPVLGQPCKEMVEAIAGAQTALAPYWQCFSHMAGEQGPEPVWRGPAEEAAPPHDIMSTAAPRGEEDGRGFRLKVAQLVADTPLVNPETRLVVSKSLENRIVVEKVVVVLDPVVEVMLGRARVAIVEGIESLVKVEGRVLLVDCGEEENLPSSWNVAKLERRGDGLVLREGDSQPKELKQVVVTQLLPLAYKLAPHLVVVRSVYLINCSQPAQVWL